MKKSTITLNIIHLPVLLLMLAVAVSSGGVALKTRLDQAEIDQQHEQAAQDAEAELALNEEWDTAAVLSEDDEREEEDDDHDDDMEEENEDEDENEDENEDEEDEDDDRGKSKEKTEREFEREIERNGVKVKEKYKIKTENGKTEEEYEFEAENEGYDDDVNEQEDADDDDVSESTSSKKNFAYFSPYLKVKVHEANENSQGASSETRVKIMVKQGLENAGLAEAVEELELTLEQTGQSSASLGSYTYKGVAQKSEALLGLFHISIPVDVVIDPETGEVIDQNQSLVSKILDLFSF